MVVMELMTLLLLARHRVPLKRDVIFAATATKKPKVSMAWAGSSESILIWSGPSGGFRVRRLRLSRWMAAASIPCQTAEKGVCWLKLRARGKPGHAAMPHGDNAVAHLARAVDRLSRQRMPLHFTPTAARYVQGMSAVMGGARRLALKALLNRVTHDRALDWLTRASQTTAGRSSACFTTRRRPPN